MKLVDFILLLSLSSAAVIYAAPRQLKALRAANIPFPARNAFAILQGIIFCAIGAGLGTALRGITGFEIFGPPGASGPVIGVTVLGFLGHVFIYYAVFRHRLPKQSMLLAERIRLAMGLPARVLQGGIAEEVQFRWGLMSLLAAPIILLFPKQVLNLIPLAVGISALLFAYFHLVGARQLGLARNKLETALIIIDNTWGGIVFGWLLWQYGLVAAAAAHAFFHLAWYPIEKMIYKRETRPVGDS